METQEIEVTEVPGKKKRLTDAAVNQILHKGYAATSVDDICAEAGVTKGSFFHYFASKEFICLAAMDEWSAHWGQLVRNANLDAIADPLDRVDGLFEVMRAAYMSPGKDPGCVVGTVTQEVALSNPKLRGICGEHLELWQRETSRLLADAKAAHPPVVDFDADELAWWLCSFVQGTLLIAKTRTERSMILSNLRHCQAYVHSLFGKE